MYPGTLALELAWTDDSPMSATHKPFGQSMSHVAAMTPLVSDGDRCAYSGCTELHSPVRVSECGFRIAYCARHFEQANRLFGKPSRKEKAA